MIQAEFTNAESQLMHALMSNDAAKALFLKLIERMQGEMLEILTSWAKAGSPHETAKCAGYLMALEELMPAMESLAKQYVSPSVNG